MILEIFGSGCEKCRALEAAVHAALDELGLASETTIYRIEDPACMVGRGVWRAPGLAVDGRVVSRGRELTAAEVGDLIRSAGG